MLNSLEHNAGMNNMNEKLSDITKRKFIDTLDVNDYEILTDTGWKDIKHVSKTVKYTVYEMSTKSHTLKCADDHIVFDECMNERFVKDLHAGDKV